MMHSLNYILGIDGLYWAVGIIIAFLIMLILILRSGHGYSVHDTEAHSTEFGGVIKEGHGGMTAFLWALYAFMIIWTVVYFIRHAGEFAIIFAGAG